MGLQREREARDQERGREGEREKWGWKRKMPKQGEGSLLCGSS